ncbi:hypothetical protein WR25_26083 [Diploscapter pachys]|uniref:Uncharacterized protein n=1 Tax=Diploscapter pachys TaxID=2018661 RepID=A0A2A2K7L2_9BILA|nr:hypothetical protein WR25_26083 [Diploscapter pachys]
MYNGNEETSATGEMHVLSDTQQMVSTHGLLPDPQSPLQKGTTDLVSGQDQDQFDQYSSDSSSMLLPPIHSGPFLPNCNSDSSPTTRISSIASDNQHSTGHVQLIDAVSSPFTPSSRPHSTPSLERQTGVDPLLVNSDKTQNTMNSPNSCPSKCLQSGSNKCTQKVATSSITPDEKVGETEVSDLAERPVVKKGRFSLPIPTHPHNQL